MYTVRIFMKCMHVCAAQKAYLLFTKLFIKPDFPSLADEIAESHLDMNIKVAAFTVREKSSNTYVGTTFYAPAIRRMRKGIKRCPCPSVRPSVRPSFR